MNIFISVYHVIKDILHLPVDIVNKLKSKSIEHAREEELAHRKMMQETIENSTSFAGDNAKEILELEDHSDSKEGEENIWDKEHNTKNVTTSNFFIGK